MGNIGKGFASSPCVFPGSPAPPSKPRDHRRPPPVCDPFSPVPFSPWMLSGCGTGKVFVRISKTFFLFYNLVTENQLLPKHLSFTIRLASRVFIFFILSSFHRKAERPKTLRFFYAPAYFFLPLPPGFTPFFPGSGIVIPGKACYNKCSVVSF